MLKPNIFFGDQNAGSGDRMVESRNSFTGPGGQYVNLEAWRSFLRGS